MCFFGGDILAHGQQCGDCRRGRGRMEVEEGTEGINEDGKNKIKKIF